MTFNTDGTLKTYAINNAGILVEAGLPEGKAYYAIATVTLDYETIDNAKKTKDDYVGAAGVWTATVNLAQDKTTTHANDPDVKIGSWNSSTQKFTDDADGSLTFDFTIAADGTLSNNTFDVAVRVSGDSIAKLGQTGATQTPDSVLTNGLSATISVASTATFKGAL